MSIFDSLKRWVGLIPKPDKPGDSSSPVEKTQLLPNGRIAVVDEAGNFIRWSA